MTKLRLYNTLTRRKEEFTPIDPANVRLYVCGPTVYDFAHIGNARPVIVFDVLFRLLRHIYGEAHVTYVRNITDVDDKINARAARDFPGLPLNEAIRRVTEKTYDQFKADVAALGALPPTHEPRATEHIDGMVAIINTLLAKGHAYLATGPEGREVLFSVGSMPDYGQLSKRKLEDQVAGARVAVEAHKRNAADFVLWKESAVGEPGWPGAFEGGVIIHGRPGWHIECSAMSQAFLGETFDIHGGGLDLIFPHHENEIAQSRCAHGTSVMANIWMHNGFLQVEGQKMSKSLGNFVTIQELLETEKFGGRRWPGEVLRLAMLKTHYRQPIDWTVKSLEEAHDLLDRLTDSGDVVDNRQTWNPKWGRRPTGPSSDLVAALCDDLNGPSAVAALAKLVSKGSDSLEEMARKLFQIREDLKFIGIDMKQFGDARFFETIDSARVTWATSLITARNAARAAKNFAESDRIRDELLAMGIQLKDGKDAEGNPVTTWEVKR